MANILKNQDFAGSFCENAAQNGKIVSDGPGKAQVRSGLQRNFAIQSTNNPGREDRADKLEVIQQPFWRSQPNSCGQRAMKRLCLMQELEMESDGRRYIQAQRSAAGIYDSGGKRQLRQVPYRSR